MSGELRTQSGIALKPIYRPDDLADFSYDKKLADPGSFPYTRGRRLETAGGNWIWRELSGEGDPQRSNEQLKYLLSKGQMGIDFVADTPSYAMLDADHPSARYAVGTQGVSLCRKVDYVDLLRDIPLDEISVSASVRAEFGVIGLYMAAKELGFDPARLRGSVVQGPLFGEDCCYAVHLPLNLRLRLCCDSIEFSSEKMPKFHSFLEDTYYISDGGLDSIEEMALGFLEIRLVVRELLRRGVPIDSFAPRIAILVNGHTDLFETVAKIRATRRLYARMMRDEFGAKDPRSMSVNVTGHSSGLSLTAEQPANNIVRGAIQALAMALAGVQAMEISTFDEAYRTPSPESHEVGLRTQQIIQLESLVAQVNDPLGGSYFVESLTDDVENRIWKMVNDIEAMGDLMDLSEHGYFRRIFADTMMRNAQWVAEGKIKKVGVNCFRVPSEEDTLLRDVVEQKFEPALEHIEKVKRFRLERDQGAVDDALQIVLQRAREPEANLMYPMMDALEANATMGEIAGILRIAYDHPYDPFHALQSPIAA
jgi:methylmalonyl-CoA mutase cobalamin-binding domain/chain